MPRGTERSRRRHGRRAWRGARPLSPRSAALGLVVLLVAGAGCGGDEPEPTMRVLVPADGAVQQGPFVISVETEGIEIGPQADGSAHLHAVFDECVPEGDTIPTDPNHAHYPDGERSFVIDVPDGTYRLCLQLGDADDKALGIDAQLTFTMVDPAEAGGATEGPAPTEQPAG